MTARHPAAWINTVYEGRNFDEAIGYLQNTWDDLRDAEIKLAEALQDVGRLVEELAEARAGLREARWTLEALRIRLHAAGRRPEECYEMSLIDDALARHKEQP